MVEDITLKLKRIRLSKLSSIFAVFGLLIGFILGFIFFLLVKFSSDLVNLDTTIGGLIILSFILVPLIISFLFYIFGFINGLIFNLSLKVVKGLDALFDQEV